MSDKVLAALLDLQIALGELRAALESVEEAIRELIADELEVKE